MQNENTENTESNKGNKFKSNGKLSIVNSFKLDELPDIIYLDLSAVAEDTSIHSSIRAFATYLNTLEVPYCGIGLFFMSYLFEKDAKTLQELYAIAKLAGQEIDSLNDTNIKDLPELHNMMILTYLFARCEGVIDMKDVEIRRVEYTVKMIALTYYASMKKAEVNLKNFTVFPKDEDNPDFGGFLEHSDLE